VTLKRRIIPCLDVRDGRVVKGVRFRGLRDAGDPVECAERYDREGADELVILDVSATNEARDAAAHTVSAVRKRVSIPITVGGGVRGFDSAERLLAAGADKVAINTAAVVEPSLITEIAERAGRQCVVVAIDAARRENTDRFEVVTHAGTRRTGIDAADWAARAEQRGAGEILLTSYDRDGTGEGYDTELISAIARAVRIPIIASGGAASTEHMCRAFDAGADAVLAASIFHDAVFTVADVKAVLATKGIEVRQ